MRKTLLSITILLVAALMVATPNFSPQAAAQDSTTLKIWHYESPDGAMGAAWQAAMDKFEELHPEPALFGTGALGRALVEMWQRRMELNLFLPVAFAFRHLHPAMKDWEVPQVPEWGEANKPKAVEFLHLLDGELAGREFAAGDAYSIADITGMIAIDFMKPARIEVPADCVHVQRWYEAVSSRPSASA